VLSPEAEVLVTPSKGQLVPVAKFLAGLGLVCEVEVLDEMVPLSGEVRDLPWSRHSRQSGIAPVIVTASVEFRLPVAHVSQSRTVAGGFPSKE